MAVTVTASNVPSSMSVRKTLNPTIEMMADILSLVGFDKGSFILSVQERQRKKADMKFQAIREDQNYILVRCKPGGNDTCYLWRLQPENGSLGKSTLTDLLDRLNQIHPKRLSIPTATSGESQEEPKPVLAEHHQNSRAAMQRTTKIPDPVEGSTGETKTSTGCGMMVDSRGKPCGAMPTEFIETASGQKAAACAEHAKSKEWKELVAQAQAEKERKLRREREELEEQLEPSVSTGEPGVSYETLKITYPEVQSLVDDEEAVDKSLVAACFVMKQDGSAGREDVTSTIVHELGLEEFCKSSPTYNTVRSAVRVCIDGLVKHGYVTRFQYRPRKRNRKHAGTEGYMITPHGRERIATIMDDLTDEMTQRFWSGPPENLPNIPDDVESEEGVSPEDFPQGRSPDPHPAPSAPKAQDGEDNTFTTLEAQGVFDTLRKKLDEYDKLNSELQENCEMISMARKEAQKPEITIMGLDQKIGELRKQVEELEANISELETERDNAISKKDSEIEPVKEWERRNEEIKARLEELNEEIRSATQR